MNYTLYADTSFSRSLKKLSPQTIEHIQTVVLHLQTRPRLGEQLKGKFRFLWSLHTKLNNTDYRIVYTINDRKREIMVHYVATRENFYEEIKRLQLK